MAVKVTGAFCNSCCEHCLFKKDKKMAMQQSKCCANARYQLTVVRALLYRSYSCKTDWFNNKENYVGGIHRILLVLKQNIK